LPFSDPELYLQHILENIAHVEEFTAGMDFATYHADFKTKSATERQIQILSEAASRLGDQSQVLAPEVDWRSIRGMGNRLRHGYDFIDDEKVWSTIQFDLPPLRDAVTAALLRMKGQGTREP
jgi:uncharacterized protein with HEPN domain